MKQKVVYDKAAEVLSIELAKSKSVDSDIHGNVVMDYDKNGGLVRVNFYNFNFDLFREKISDLKSFVRNSRARLLVR